MSFVDKLLIPFLFLYLAINHLAIIWQMYFLFIQRSITLVQGTNAIVAQNVQSELSTDILSLWLLGETEDSACSLA